MIPNEVFKCVSQLTRNVTLLPRAETTHSKNPAAPSCLGPECLQTISAIYLQQSLSPKLHSLDKLHLISTIYPGTDHTERPLCFRKRRKVKFPSEDLSQ